MTKRTIQILFCYTAVYLIWGVTYFFIAQAVETMPASWIVASRFLLGGIILMLIPVLSGKITKFPTRQEVGTSLFLGFFLLIMGNGVVTIAENWVDSYVVSLIISTIPLIVAVLNMLIYKTKLNMWQILGFFIGFGGVALLLYSDTPRQSNELKGIILIFLAISCWGFATSWSKKLTHHSDTFFSTGMQMLFAGLIALIVTFVQGGDFQEIANGISKISLYSTIFLTFVGGSAIGAYNFLLKNEPTSRITSYALVNPLIATLVGILIGKEEPAQFLIPGVFMILTGLIFMLYLGKLSRVIEKG